MLKDCELGVRVPAGGNRTPSSQRPPRGRPQLLSWWKTNERLNENPPQNQARTTGPRNNSFYLFGVFPLKMNPESKQMRVPRHRTRFHPNPTCKQPKTKTLFRSINKTKSNRIESRGFLKCPQRKGIRKECHIFGVKIILTQITRC